jgi:hypothetical protein
MPIRESYLPGRAPSVQDPEVSELALFMQRELTLIATALRELTIPRWQELAVAPEPPRDGMIVYADGTNWNPGSGEGFYGRQAGAWVKL